jgi:hypothetical protein
MEHFKRHPVVVSLGMFFEKSAMPTQDSLEIRIVRLIYHIARI